MRHQKTRHKLSRSASHRKALLANLCKEVIQHERIKTSEAKAKAVKPEVEQLITLAKRGDLHARRQALSILGQDKFTVHKLFEEVRPAYAERPAATPASSSSVRVAATRPRWSTSSSSRPSGARERPWVDAERPLTDVRCVG
jgi:large subunit ribosomal protein L17